MLMTERCRFSCMELQYVLWAEEVEPFLARLRPPGLRATLRSDRWWISTVYLDRPDRSLSTGALACPEVRTELRLREYFTPEGEAVSPFVWVESKGQTGRSSCLTRFQLHRRLIPRFLGGDLDDEEILEGQPRFIERDRVLPAIRAVRDVSGSGSLVAAGAVSSLRLALEGGNPQARITLDRDMAYHLGPLPLSGKEPSLKRDRLGLPALEEPSGVVEIKYRGFRRPTWCEQRLDPAAGPMEYSKFQILSALGQSDRQASRSLLRRPSSILYFGFSTARSMRRSGTSQINATST